MLILSRRNGESFIIGEDIKITVLSQRSNQVRIGIEAPRSLPVNREEVLLRKAQQEIALTQLILPDTNNNSNSKPESKSVCETTEKNLVFED